MSLWLRPAQLLVNQTLEYDPSAQRKLADLSGRTLMVKVTEPSVTVVVTIESGGFVLLSDVPVEQADAQIGGTAKALMAVMGAKDRTAAMMENQITIQGDTRTFFALQSILAELDIDWEMALADRLGDVPAHFLADGLKFAVGMAKQQWFSFKQTQRNYWREEADVLVPSSLWAPHRKALREAQLQTDRLSARLAALEAKFAARENQNKDRS